MKFYDKDGNKVKAGDEIRIDHHYTLQQLVNGKKAVVFWDEKRGMYKWRLVHDKRICQNENFYGVHSFTLLNKEPKPERSVANADASSNDAGNQINHQS